MVSPAASQAVHRGPIPLDRRGELFELVMEPVLKTGGCKSLGGSNPSLSAIFNTENLSSQHLHRGHRFTAVLSVHSGLTLRQSSGGLI